MERSRGAASWSVPDSDGYVAYSQSDIDDDDVLPPHTSREVGVMIGRLLTVEEAAAALNTTPRFVRRLIAERRICFHHVGRHVRIAEKDLAAFVEAGRVRPVEVRWHAGRVVS